MKYCYHCGHMTAGEPLFCDHCGRSYDVKLCPRLHPNPRGAEVCSQCGSRELSTPQPKIPMSWQAPCHSRPAGSRTPALLSDAFARDRFRQSPQFQQAMVCIGLLLVVPLVSLDRSCPTGSRKPSVALEAKRRTDDD